MNGEQRPGSYFAHAQDDLNLRILRVIEDTFCFTQPIYNANAQVIKSGWEMDGALEFI